jgi:hypothetical protein
MEAFVNLKFTLLLVTERIKIALKKNQAQNLSFPHSRITKQV